MRRLLFLVLAASLSACSGVRSLDAGGGDTPAALSAGEQALVRDQAQKALAEGRFADAWDQEVQAGARRAELEAIALAALEADSGDAADMLRELRGKWGALGSGTQQGITDLIQARMSAGRWVDAADVAIVAATDAPTYATAFQVYEQTPVRHAADVLERIMDARTKAQAGD